MREWNFDVTIHRTIRCLPDSLKIKEYEMKGGEYKNDRGCYFMYLCEDPKMNVFLQGEDEDMMYIRCTFGDNVICEKNISYGYILDMLNQLTKLLTRELYKEE